MPSEQSDRGGSQNGASAMAMAAAAMQQVMCLKMMADAQAEGNSEKMTMAMMMCAQAAATAANAAQNKEGAKKVTQNSQTPNAPSFEKPNIDTQPKADNFNSALDSTKDQASSKPSDKKQDSTVTFPRSEEKESGTVFQEEKKFGSTGTALNPGDLKPGPSSTISLKEPAMDQPRSTLMGSLNPFGSPNNSANPNLPSNSSSTQSNELSDSKSGKKSLSKSADSSASGAPGGNMDDLMARYLNGANNLGSLNSGGLGGGFIDLALGLQIPGQRPKTIFEFASEQYQNSRPKRSIPVRQIASE